MANERVQFNIAQDHLDCLSVLDEFVRDIEAVEEEQVKADWPDLHVTYLKARKLTRDEGD